MRRSVLVLLVWVFAFELAYAQKENSQTVRWLRGRDLDRRTQVALNAQWYEAPLRPLLTELSQGLGIPLFIDRRVDPEILVSLTVNNLTWEQLLFEFGKPHGLGFCRLGRMYYFGPNDVALTLPQHFEKLNDWVGKNRKQATVNWRQPVDGSWPRLSQPANLLAELSSARNVETFELERIPLDVWDEHASPSRPMILQAALLVVGFDKWISISKSGTKLKVVPYPQWDQTRFTVGKLKSPDDAIQKLQSQFSELSFEPGNKSVEISGPNGQIAAAVAEAIRLQSAFKNQEAQNTFNGTLNGSRRSILNGLSQQLGLELELDTADTTALDKYVEITVKDASVQEIVSQVLSDSGLRYQLNLTTLKVWKQQ